MSGKDYSKQVEKRQKIKKTTLVVGLDIGSEFNAMGMMNKTGEIIGRYPKVYNSRKGFEYFKRTIETTKKKIWIKKGINRDGANGALLEEDRLLCKRARV